jgi:hypothetical protein
MARDNQYLAGAGKTTNDTRVNSSHSSQSFSWMRIAMEI